MADGDIRSEGEAASLAGIVLRPWPTMAELEGVEATLARYVEAAGPNVLATAVGRRNVAEVVCIALGMDPNSPEACEDRRAAFTADVAQRRGLPRDGEG